MNTGRRRTTANRLVVALVLGAIAASCSADDVGSGATVPGGASSAVTVGSSVPDDNGARFRIDGVTFLYPAEFFSDVDSIPGSEVDAELGVSLASDRGDVEMTFTVVRTPNGDDVAGLPAPIEEQLADLEVDLSAGTQHPGSVGFINGNGRRTIEPDGYEYLGLTSDGRLLLRVTSELASDDDVAQLDAMIRTVFVDGSAPEFAVDGCSDDIELLDDRGLAAGTAVAPLDEVRAVWEVRNSGTCTWGAGHSWVFTGGDAVTLVATSGLAGVQPGESTEIEVTFLAPARPGRYSAQWQLQPPSGFETIGPAAFVIFDVAE